MDIYKGKYVSKYINIVKQFGIGMVPKTHELMLYQKYSLHITETYVPCIFMLNLYKRKFMHLVVSETVYVHKMITNDNF